MAGSYLPGRAGSECEALVMQRVMGQHYDVALPVSEIPSGATSVYLRPEGCVTRSPAGARSKLGDPEVYRERWDFLSKVV